MPIRWNSCIILAKIEATYGADPAPTGAANAILMTDVSLTPMDGEDVSRNLMRPYHGAQEEIPAGLRVQLTGSTELVGSGAAGTAPPWGVLARACGLAQVVSAGVNVVYSPISDGHEAITIYVWWGGTRQVLSGVRGTATLTINAQGIPTLRWTLTGLWNQPAEVARATPSFDAWEKPQIASNANTPDFTIGGDPFVLRSFSLDLGCQVAPRLMIGREEIWIEERSETVAATIEAVPLTTFDPFAIARQGSDAPQEVEITHGTIAGRIVSLNAPTCQLMRPTGYAQAQGVVEWPLRFKPLPNLGNDQFTLTLT